MHSELTPLLDALAEVILGKEQQIRLALCCLLARGHLLIEDIPGVGKTTLSHALAQLLGLSYQRVQFTSDLLPADILGAAIYDERERAFRFHPGPIFRQVVLADEINRASPKTQSALYGNNLGFLLTGMALVALHHTRRQLEGVSCRLLPSEPVFAGEQAYLPLVVENQGDAPKWGLAAGEPVRFSLAPGESRRIELPYPAPVRGVHRIGGLRLGTAFPTGWFRAERTFDGAWTLWVYPEPADGPPPPLGTTAAEEGEREFAGFRAYRPGGRGRRGDL